MRVVRWVLGAIILLLGWVVLGSLVHVFQSAKAAARMSTTLDHGTLLSRAAASYADSHSGRLPGRDWRVEAERIDPGLRGKWSGVEGDWHVGFAAVPGTLGKRLESLPPDAVLYVEYRCDHNADVLAELRDIGDADREGQAVVVTAGDVTGPGHARFVPLARIGYLLGRQGANLP